MYATIPELSDLILRGYIVAATDYPGLGTPGPHPYLIGRSEGQAVLDSVRAARKWSSDAGSQFVTWGFSQGGQAALFAGQLAGSYAPELTLAGVAAIAPVTDLGDLLHHALGSDVAVSAYMLVAWSKVYQLSLDDVVRSAAIPALKRVAQVCSQTTIESYQVKFNALPLRAPFVEPSLYTTSPWDGLLATNKPGLAPAAPIYLAQGKFDELVPADVTVAFARAECKLGAHVLYSPLADVGHNPADVRSAPDAISWISDRFAGKPAPDSCPLDSP
jgi:alpha-beta hydrolase superfamily lysophospholipase